MPSQIYEMVGAVFCAFQCMGVIFAYLLGGILPDDADEAGLLATNRWRIIYVYFPFTMMTIFLISLLLQFKLESVKFLIKNKQMKHAKTAVSKIYIGCEKESQQMSIINALARSLGEDTSKYSLRDALCNEEFRRATWVNFGYIIFHELTGINVILQYSNTILAQINSNGGFALSAR